MAYEIPQQLEYKEKIIFGLTFKQLAYAFGFAPLMIIVFFKTDLNIVIRSFITTVFGSIAIGFMFLNLDYHFKSWIGWIKHIKIINPKDLDQLIGIEKIENNLIYDKNKRKLAILKVESINFAIKPQDAQEAIIASFQKFLNSLDFPVQILMNTENLSLDEYFKAIKEKIKKYPQFEKLSKEYIEYLSKTITKNNVQNRNFYLIIPEKQGIEIQLPLCTKRLGQLGLKSYQLKNNELRSLINKFFSGDAKETLFELENNPSYIKLNNNYVKVLFAHGYPRNVEHGFLDKIVSLLGDFDFSIHIEPYDIETMMIYLNKELQKQRADLYSSQTKGILNPSLEIKYADTKATLENLQKGKDKLFNVSLYINCRAKSKESLEMLTKRIESEFNSLLIIPKYPYFRMVEAFQSCSPLAQNKLNMTRNVPTGALSAFFPFTSSFLQSDSSGIWFGLNKNNIPIIKDIFKLSNPNGFCLASSGAGKSYMSKLFIARHLLSGTKVIVIDPQGEYARLVKKFNGQRIDLSRDSKTIINPLDLMGHEYHEKRLALMDLFPLMLGDLTDPQKSFLDRAITEAYSLYGITSDPETWGRKPPILQDIMLCLKRMEKKAAKIEESTLRSLINRLDMYVNGVFSFLNKHTTVNFDNNFVCFDIGNLPKQVKPTMMFLVLDYVYMKMKSNLERKLLVIDEAWSLLGRTADASYIFEIVKTCRKFNLALFLVNQEVEGMLNSDAGKSVLANSSYTLLMRQKPAVINQVQRTFFLSEAERLALLTASVGEGLMLMDDEHSEIRIVASEEEHKLITTNADELLEANTPKKETKVIKVETNERSEADSDWRVHRIKSISKNDSEYLDIKGFKKFSFKNIYGSKEEYLLKPRANEGAEHCFLTYDIANYLKVRKIAFDIYNSVEADIVFKANGKEYALEIETGVVLKTKKSKLREKVKRLNKKYGENWFFVLTDRNLVKYYKEYGKTLTKRNILKKLGKIVSEKA